MRLIVGLERDMTLEVEDGSLRNSDISFCNAAQSMPNRVALSDSTRETTWSELDHRANQIARKLIDHGVGPNDKVALLSANSVTYVEVMFGILRAGACIVPLPTHTSSATWSAMVKDSGARMLFASEGYVSEVKSGVDIGRPESDIIQLDEATLTNFVSGVEETLPNV